MIEALCQEWCGRCDKIASHILILSPYKAQVQGIRRALNNANLTQIDVLTVDAAQGLEQDIVIISLARNRSGAEKRNAFFNDRRRINVLLSRARKKIIIVAAVEEVKKVSENWGNLFDIIWEQRAEEQEKTKLDEDIEAQISIFDMVSHNNPVPLQ